MLCARLLRHQPEAEKEKGRVHISGAAVARFFDKVIAEYGRMLTWVLDHSKLTWLVFIATLVVTVLLYFVVPKGFFPEQDTGTIAATTEADQSISFAAMAERQQALAEHLLRTRPWHPSLVYRCGWHQHHAQYRPHPDRPQAPCPARPSARGAQTALAEDSCAVPGIRLYAQPVQDLTIEDRW